MSFWKRLLGQPEEEVANPFGGTTPVPVADVQADVGHEAAGKVHAPPVSFRSDPAEASWTTVSVNGKALPAEQARAFAGAFEQVGRLATTGATQVVDLRNVPGLREAMLKAMGTHASDPTALQGAVAQVLEDHGVALPEPGEQPPIPPPAEPPASGV